MKIETVSISKVKLNPDNPRTISKDAFAKLVKSLKEFPEMKELREIVVDEDYMVLGGNMRLRALKEIGEKKVTVKVAEGFTPEQKREFVIKDNAAFGDWDFDLLANDWGDLPLGEWGVDIPNMNNIAEDENNIEESRYTNKIVIPIYEPKGECPLIHDLIDRNKTENLIEEINNAGLPDDISYFLRMAAERHTKFHFRRIAEYYCHSNAQVQDLMEKSGLVIIDFKKAIEYGFAHMTERLGSLADMEEGKDEDVN